MSSGGRDGAMGDLTEIQERDEDQDNEADDSPGLTDETGLKQGATGNAEDGEPSAPANGTVRSSSFRRTGNDNSDNDTSRHRLSFAQGVR